MGKQVSARRGRGLVQQMEAMQAGVRALYGKLADSRLPQRWLGPQGRVGEYKSKRQFEQACMLSLSCLSLEALCVLAESRLQRGWHKEQCREAHLVSDAGSYPPVIHSNN